MSHVGEASPLAGPLVGLGQPLIGLGRLLAQAGTEAGDPVTSAAVHTGLFSPWAVLGLCLLGAVGIGLLLPANRPATLRRVGGAIAAVGGLILALLLVSKVDHLGITGEVGAYFWAFTAIAVVSAVRVITHPRPVYSALYFVLTVFASAGLFVLLQAEFMAAALVLIYAGAVLVTYVFVIMLAAESSGGTGSHEAVGEADRVSRDPFLAGAVGFTLLGLLLLTVFDKAPAAVPPRASPGASALLADMAAPPAVSGDTQRLGAYLYQQQLVPIQVAMLLLTLAMTGAVVIARRKVYIPAGASMGGASMGGASMGAAQPAPGGDMLSSPATPADDDPHSIPVYGTQDPAAKQYPQT